MWHFYSPSVLKPASTSVHYLADLVNMSETTFQNSTTLVGIVFFSSELSHDSVSNESKTNLNNNIQPELPIIQLWQKK